MEKNKQVRDYTHIEASYFSVADENMKLLEIALNNAITTEKECSHLYGVTHPDAGEFNPCYRIANLIAKYENVGKFEPKEQYEEEKDPSPIARIAPIKTLK